MRALLFVILTTVTLGAQAKTALLQHVPLKWSPTSDLRLGTMEMSQAPIQFEPFQDVAGESGGHRRESRGRGTQARHDE